MAVTTAFSTRMKQGLLQGTENFLLSGGDTYKLALYNDSATYGAATTNYSATNEVGASGSYSAGGGTLTRIDPATSGTTAYTDFADISFTTATIASSGAMIYNDTDASDPTCTTHYFGSIITSTAGTFNVVFPTADATNAVIRIA
jgi:hypothetical protein